MKANDLPKVAFVKKLKLGHSVEIKITSLAGIKRRLLIRKES